MGFKQENYIGENIVIVGTGDIKHSELVAAVKRSFKMPDAGKPGQRKEQANQSDDGMSLDMDLLSDSPEFTPRIMAIHE